MVIRQKLTTCLGTAVASALSLGVFVSTVNAGVLLPDLFEVETKDLNSITFKWDAITAPAPSVTYRIGLDAEGDGRYDRFISFTDTTSGKVDSLASGKTYTFAIETLIDGRVGPRSEPISVSVEKDSDSDGLYDSRECTTLVPLVCPDTDGDGIPNNLDSDDDGDEILTIDEGLQADGTLLDTDSDSLPDYLEPNNVDTDNNGQHNNDDADDDGDTARVSNLTTEFEVDGQTLFPPDVDNDSIPDYLDGDVSGGMEDGSGDSDNDGKSDKEECSTPPFCTEDLDNDGLPDYLDNTDDRVKPAATPEPEGPIKTGLDGAGGGSLGVAGLSLSFLALMGRGLSRRRKLVVIKPTASTAMKKIALASAIMAITGSSAVAGTSQWYFGGGLGGSLLDPDTSATSLTVADDNSIGMKLFGGYDFTNHLTVEGFAADLGDAELSNKDDVSYTLFGVSGLVYLKPSLPGPNAFFKAGISTLGNDSDSNYKQTNDTQAFIGIGGEYQYESGISVRAEYEFFADDASFLSVSLMRRFGEVYVPPAPEVKIVEVEAVPPIDGDDDKDGVTNSIDQCPGTAPGVEVDAKGCDFDLDRDGVLNNVDQCPGTPAGMAVHANGCPMFTGFLEGVHFESDSDVLKGNSTSILRQVAEKMNGYPALNVVIVGHTDSTASDAHNQVLSIKRAKSVGDYLQSQGVDAARLRYVGYGEKYPRATNKTEAGKQLNRRVELLPRK